MKITFYRAALASLCNSEQRLVELWGKDDGHMVGRRLLELRAVDTGSIENLPKVVIKKGNGGDTTIDFGGKIIVRGLITSANLVEESILITSIEVKGSVRK